MNKKVFSDRKLHLVDIENVTGSARPSRAQIEAFRSTYDELGLMQDGDLMIVACNHGAAIEVMQAWLGPRLLIRSGPDGADLAPLGVIANENVVARFGEVVVCSGDGIFAEEVARLASAGLATTVVSRVESLATRLMLAAGSVVILMDDPEPIRLALTPEAA